MKKNIRSLFCFILVMVFCVSLACPAFAMETAAVENLDANYPQTGPVSTYGQVYTNTYCMTTYYDYNFYAGSTEKDIYLENYCVEIAFRCTTSTGENDYIHICITDVDGNGAYSKEISLLADGNSHWQTLYLPAGHYKVYFSGSALIHHVNAAVNFYAINP